MQAINSFMIYGARGTTPAVGPHFARHGGQTTCYSLRTPQGLIVIDAGTGLIELGQQLARSAKPPPIALLFTHFHLDHLMGLPLFKPLSLPQAHITLLGGARGGQTWPAALTRLCAPPYWPISLRDCRAQLHWQNLPRTQPLNRYGARISWCPLNHPQDNLAYRLELAGRAIVIITDHEFGQPGFDDPLRRFCQQADVLLVDAQYLPRELPARRGWGHGTWPAAAELARAAGAAELILTHHDRYRTDSQISALVRQCRQVFRRTRAARAGLCWSLGPQPGAAPSKPGKSR